MVLGSNQDLTLLTMLWDHCNPERTEQQCPYLCAYNLRRATSEVALLYFIIFYQLAESKVKAMKTSQSPC